VVGHIEKHYDTAHPAEIGRHMFHTHGALHSEYNAHDELKHYIAELLRPLATMTPRMRLQYHLHEEEVVQWMAHESPPVEQTRMLFEALGHDDRGEASTADQSADIHRQITTDEKLPPLADEKRTAIEHQIYCIKLVEYHHTAYEQALASMWSVRRVDGERIPPPDSDDYHKLLPQLRPSLRNDLNPRTLSDRSIEATLDEIARLEIISDIPKRVDQNARPVNLKRDLPPRIAEIDAYVKKVSAMQAQQLVDTHAATPLHDAMSSPPPQKVLDR